MSDNKISKTILQYKELTQLQEFAEAQNTTILQLSKKNQSLEEKVKHLENILKTTVPTISSLPNGVEDIADDDSEYICLVEIAKLKRFTNERELTLEESRRFDTYYKILNNINSKPKQEKEVKETPTGDLLKIVESKNDSGSSK
jgi:hypothetical protein